MSGYIGVQPVPQATQTRDIITATAGQTSFATGGYTPQFLDVYLNGVHLQNGTDYTASNGSDVVLTTGAAVDDVLEVVAYTTFELVSPTFGGTLTADNISDGTDTVGTGYVVNGSAKAWVNVNQTGTQSTLSSFNVSSVTDDGNGRTTFFLTSSFSDANWTGVVGQSASTSINIIVGGGLSASSGFMRFRVSSTDTDADGAAAIGHGDLA